ncbi:MAG: TraB/GumN family protein [Myxococcota bacterium]
MIFARNEVMADQLVALAGNGRRRLVVLGVGHLVGPRGIPELLAARGFRVERVPRR